MKWRHVNATDSNGNWFKSEFLHGALIAKRTEWKFVKPFRKKRKLWDPHQNTLQTKQK